MRTCAVGNGRAGPRRGRGARRSSWSVAVGVALLGASTAAAQTAVTVTGTVTAAESGQPLAGATVTVKGTTTGTQTGASGTYTLQVPAPDDTLVFSMLGRTAQTIALGGRTTVDVALEQQALSLEGLVVVGYGTQQRRDVTGSVATVQGSQIDKQTTPSVAQALQGQVAGVQVTPASGAPGAQAEVRIRGVGTLNNASPLYVVDGMLLDDISFLSPNDIQSVEVLKDASATAIYGSRGANGVIIVTTKRGKGQGTRFSASAYAGVQSVEHRIDLVNAQQYAMLANELAANLGQAPYFPDANSVGAGTDWQDQIFQSAPIQSYQVGASGGSDRISYYVSGNYLRQEGVVPRSNYDRFTLRLNNDYRLTDAFRLGHDISFVYVDDRRPPNVVGTLYRADPTVAPTDENGTYNDANVRASAGNPAATVHYTNNTEQAGRLVGDVFAERDFLRDLTFRTSFGIDYNRSEYRSFVPVFYVSPTQQNSTSNLTVETPVNSSWLWENTLTYTLDRENYRLNLLGGVTAQSFYTEKLGGTRQNIAGTDPSLWYLDAGNAEGSTNYNSASNWKMLSYLFRTNYSLLDRYLLTASLRVDGSSRFGSANRYGWFPSMALGWNLAQESFLQDQDAISALKLRASWGETGNDKIGAYPGIPVVSGNLNAVFGSSETLVYGASPIALANPDVKWERTTQTDVGADFGLFQDRLAGTLDYYRRLTDGILVQVPIPAYVGVATQPFVNAAKVLNTGVEGSLNWNQEVGSVALQLGVNGSTIHNEVRSLGGGKEEILGGGLGNEVGSTTRTAVGHPIGAFWGLKTAGVFQNEADLAAYPQRGTEAPGDLRFVDVNGDGTITDADRTWLGSPIPDFTYGLNASVTWGSFDLSAIFSGQQGNEVFNGKKAVRFGVENFESSFLNRWHGEGTSNSEPRVTNAGTNYVASDRFIEDGSFFKLNNAQLGYTLPGRLTDRLNLANARVYLSGQNLFTLTGYSGYTPEIVDSNGSVIASGIDLGVYPAMRMLTAGIDLTF